MKLKNNLFALALSTFMLVGCDSSTKIKINPNKKSYKIGITQFVQHPALDTCTNAFKSEIKVLLEKENRECSFLEKNCSGDSSLAVTCANALVASNVDLIFAVATQAFQAAAHATKTIPIVGDAITSYEVALGTTLKDGAIGTNATGVSDLVPLDEQAKMIFDIMPNAKKIGLLYCTNEANSIYQIEHIEEEINKIVSANKLDDVHVSKFAFSDPSDIPQVATNAAKSDIIYVPTDNACASAASAIYASMKKNGREHPTPIVTGEMGMCTGMGVATFSLSYDDLGKLGAEMAVDILLGREDVTKMAVKHMDDKDKLKKYYVPSRCEECGLDVEGKLDGYSVLEL